MESRIEQMLICRDFTGATRLEPATSGVKAGVHSGARALGRRRVDDRGRRWEFVIRKVVPGTQIASVLQAAGFRGDVIMFRLNAASEADLA
jgi:hypothetical protein